MHKIIVTAGITEEHIDSVKSIVGESTGELGAFIVEMLLTKNKDLEIFFLANEDTISFLKNRPSNLIDLKKVTCIKTTNAESVQKSLKLLLNNGHISSVIHAMSVSDYSVKNVFSLEEIIYQIELNDFTKEEIIYLLQNPQDLDTSDRVSSTEFSSISINLEKTPKLLDFIKETSPRTQVIGFKNMHNVSLEQLDIEGRELLERSEADIIIANDSNKSELVDHNAFIITKSNVERFVWTKKGNGSKILLAATISNLVSLRD